MPQPAEETPSPDLTGIAVEWLVRLRGGNLSEAQTHAFADWLSESIEHANAFAKAERYFNEMVTAEKLLRPAGKALARQEHTPSPVVVALPRRTFKPWLAIPLGLAAVWLVAVGLVLPSQSGLLDNLLSDYHTQTGETRHIELADGSHLLLNTNTAVSVDYQPSQRLITLHHGQVNCTVAKDAMRPFEVKADNLVVRALGTVFEVYRKTANDITVTVKEHAVSARIQKASTENNAGEPTQVNIQAGQQLIYQGDGNLPQPFIVNLAQSAAWQHHHLSIKDRPLSELVGELNRYRLGRIYLAGDTLQNMRVTGVFPLDNPEAVLSSVRKVLGLQESRLGPWWVLLHR
ncbi:FecR family protein [Methyloglobulus sp.]|uniref:FecR family protein n=1 Tax=Methyloglobulus sp. TaxID=2518622 RepID=UPI00185007A9|nr:FecR family protein [Methyloglobulus sp.]